MKLSFKTIMQTIVFIAAIFLLTTRSYSQTTQFRLVLNEVTTNFNYGKSNGALRQYKKSITGLQAGASLQIGFTPAFSLVPELYFMMKGGILKVTNPVTHDKMKLKLYSIEMPVLARIHFGHAFINAGPYVGYTISGRIKTTGTDANPDKSVALSFDKSTGSFKRWDMGLQAGVGYTFLIQKTNLGLETRYTYGLTNLSRDIERYNRGLKISLIVIRPGKK